MTAQLLDFRPRTRPRPPASIQAALTNIRYEGSIPELRGRRGWVEQVRPFQGELRYDIALSGTGGRKVVRLVQVGPDSIVID